MRHRSTPDDRPTVRGREQAGQTDETADLTPEADEFARTPPSASENDPDILWRTG
jgi:hypothetical protein